MILHMILFFWFYKFVIVHTIRGPWVFGPYWNFEGSWEVYKALNKNCIQKSTDNVNRWIKPTKGWIKSHSNVAVIQVSGRAGASDVLRENTGLWLRSFSSNLGIFSLTSVKLWGLYYGLTHDWYLGAIWVITEVNKWPRDIIKHPRGIDPYYMWILG